MNGSPDGEPGGGRAPARWPTNAGSAVSVPGGCRSPGDAALPLWPAQAQRITAAGSAASASWTSCAPRSVAARAPLWTAPTRSWPASPATSLNTPPTCKCRPGGAPFASPTPVTPGQPWQGLLRCPPDSAAQASPGDSLLTREDSLSFYKDLPNTCEPGTALGPPVFTANRADSPSLRSLQYNQRDGW